MASRPAYLPGTPRLSRYGISKAPSSANISAAFFGSRNDAAVNSSSSSFAFFMCDPFSRWRFSKSRLKGQLADTLPRGCEDRIAQRGRRDRRARFADPTRRFVVPHHVHVDRRGLIHSQHAVVVKVRLLDPPVLELHFTPQRGADAIHDAALDLRSHDVRVDDPAAVHRAHDPMHSYVPRTGHLHFSDLRQVGAPPAEEKGHPTPMATRQ